MRAAVNDSLAFARSLAGAGRARRPPTHQGGFMAVHAVDSSSHSAISAFAADAEVPLAAQLSALRLFVDQHPLWQSPLLNAFSHGTLSRDDLQYVFSQYHL